MEIVILKFLIDFDGFGLSFIVFMVIEVVNGDINGIFLGLVLLGYFVLFVGDIFCILNYVIYVNGDFIFFDISFVVNNGGVLGDISWIDENILLWVFFYVFIDLFVLYEIGVLRVLGIGDFDDLFDDFVVVEVFGFYDIQVRLNEFGINDIFDNVNGFNVEDFLDVVNS